MFKTLKSKFFAMLFLSLTLIFLAFAFYLLTNTKTLFQKEGHKNLDTLSQTAFIALRNGMNLGSKEAIDETIKHLKKVRGIDDIEVYRSKKIDELFGTDPNAHKPDHIASKIFSTKKSVFLATDEKFHIYRPLIATKECLTCHLM